MKKYLILIVLFTGMALYIADARDFRELTSLEGTKIKAELLDLENGMLMKPNPR